LILISVQGAGKTSEVFQGFG